MNITILNGNPDERSQEFDRYLTNLIDTLQAHGHSITAFTLREMDIRSCNGCFGCWIKTPGECFSPDDGHLIRQAVIRSDFTLWASPLRMGFPSACLKMIMDKSIPLIHPYFVVENNEAHHRPRYGHYPRLGLLLSTAGAGALVATLYLAGRRTIVGLGDVIVGAAVVSGLALMLWNQAGCVG